MIARLIPLGVGDLSILGTTGIVVPSSCAAWIDSDHRGIDVAGAVRLPHIAGGVAKLTKRAQSRLDLHCGPGEAGLGALAAPGRERGASDVTAAQIAVGGAMPLGEAIAAPGWQVATRVLRPAAIAMEVAVFDRAGTLVGRKPFAPVHALPPSRKRRA